MGKTSIIFQALFGEGAVGQKVGENGICVVMGRRRGEHTSLSWPFPPPAPFSEEETERLGGQSPSTQVIDWFPCSFTRELWASGQKVPGAFLALGLFLPTPADP